MYYGILLYITKWRTTRPSFEARSQTNINDEQDSCTMQAIVLAGGYATRLWPVTRHRAKPLLPLADGTIIDPLLEDLEQETRIENVIISTNQRFESDFSQFLADRDYNKPELFIEDTESEGEKLGTLGAINLLIKEQGIERDLLVLGGDNLYSFSLTDFINRFQEKKQTLVAVYDVKDKQLARHYGVMAVDEQNRVKELQEKPKSPKSTLASTACYLFPSQAVQDLARYLERGGNPDEPGNFIKWLIKESQVFSFPFEDYWFDIGTRQAYLEAFSYFVGADWHSEGEITDSELTNAFVMDGSQVKGSRLENTVVFPNSSIEDSVIKGSIVDRQAEIKGIQLSNSLVGEHSSLIKEES